MTQWEAAKTQPDYKAFLQSRGWTESEWNATEPWERVAERVEFNGGLEPTGILRELPGAIKETVMEQGRAIGGAVTATARFTTRLFFVVAIIAVSVLLLMYKPQVSAILGKVKR